MTRSTMIMKKRIDKDQGRVKPERLLMFVRDNLLRFTLAICLLLGSLSMMNQASGEERQTPVIEPSKGAGTEMGAITAIRSCRGKTGSEKSSCYEQLFLHLVADPGVETAMEALSVAGALDQDVKRDGHVYAHAVGIAAYQHDKDVHRTFARCSEVFQSGCYHGVIQAYLDDVLDSSRAVSADRINELCASYRSDRWLLFQCVHGLGHGLTVSYQHDLLQALRACDLLIDDWDRHSCYGGAFMENIVHAIMPHHPTNRLKAEISTSARRDHDTEMSHETDVPGSSRSRFIPITASDPLYPCSILDERYLRDCYQMQTSVILYYNQGDIASAARVCDGAPPAMRIWCYQSLGRDISSYTLQQPEESIRLCSLGDPRYQPWCYVGLVKNFVDLTAKTDEGFAFCRRVPGRMNRMKCYEALGEEIGILTASTVERTAMCEQAEPDYLDACRYGARVVLKPPQ